MPRRSRIQPHDAAASDREIRRIEDAKSNAKPSGTARLTKHSMGEG
jgi:hypothetical protein